MLKLFYSPGACSLAPHIVLEETGVEYEAQAVNLKAGEQRTAAYLATNPKGKVPALQTERGVLTENPIILGYLARSFPAAALAPLDDPFAFALVQAFNVYLATTVHVEFGRVLRAARYVEGEVAAASLKAKALEMLAEAYGMINQQLSDGRPYVHGDRYTVSDPYLLAFERWYARLGSGLLERFPHVQAHLERIQARPAVRRTLAAEGIS